MIFKSKVLVLTNTSRAKKKPTDLVSIKTRPNNKRESWDDHFLEMAKLVSSRSRDKSQVGAVIIGDEQIVLSTGYNGLPRKVIDLEIRISQGKEKLKWTVHADANAICNAARTGTSLLNSTLYVNKFPCCDCAGLIVQAGIKRIVSKDDHFWTKNPNGDAGRAALSILVEAGVEIHAPHMILNEAK